MKFVVKILESLWHVQTIVQSVYKDTGQLVVIKPYVVIFESYF